MSKYTVELRNIVDNEKLFPPSVGQLSLTNILNNYPLQNADFIDPNTNMKRRDELNDKIINHYYFREIGFETVPRFLFKLQNKLNEIMKYYNQMYESIDLDINPINNVDMTETYEHTISGTGTTSTTGTNTNTNSGTSSNTSSGDGFTVDSDTPNQELTETDIKNNKFASKTSYNKGGNTSSNTVNDTSTLELDTAINSTDSKTESFTRREFGSSKGYTFAQNIQQWREIMVNVDMMIIDELNDLFMCIW